MKDIIRGLPRERKSTDKRLLKFAIVIIVIVAIAGTGVYLLTRPQAEFVVEDLSVSSHKVAQGEPFTTQVKVANVGDAEGTHTVKLEVEGETLEKKVTLDTGESRTVSFDIDKQETGTYNLDVGSLSKTFEVVEPAEFDVSNLSVNPEEVEPNENVEISVDIKNIGEVEGTKTLKLNTEGNIEKTKDVTLEGGESTTVTFSITRKTPKSYSVGIEDLSGSFKVLEPAEFEVSNLQVSPSKVGVGGTVEISVDVKNTGEVMEAHAVSIKIDGEEEYTEEITLDGGKEGTISFETSKETKKTYLVEVNGLENSFSVASVSELTQAYYSDSIVIGNIVHQVTFELVNESNQIITINKFEYYEEDGDLRNTVTSEEIEDIWGTRKVNPGESFSGTNDFRTGQPAPEEVKNWKYVFYCEDEESNEFKVSGDYVDLGL